MSIVLVVILFLKKSLSLAASLASVDVAEALTCVHEGGSLLIVIGLVKDFLFLTLNMDLV